MVTTVKFSQFAQGSTTNSTLQTVGLAAGVNSRQERFLSWMTTTRPSIPYTGLLGFNTTFGQYEYWNGVAWVQLTTGGGGAVSAVATGTGLTGGTITSTGTISFAPIAANSLWANVTGSTAVPTVIPTSTFLISADNLSDIPNAGAARTNLGLEIGSDIEAWSAVLDQVASGTYAGSTSITTLGTITAGTWEGSTITVPFGGTGKTTFTAFAVICGGTTATGALQSIAGLGNIGEVLTSNGPGALPTMQSVSGSGTVNSGLINQLAWYASTGAAVSGLATGNNGVLVTSAGGVPSISSTLPSGMSATNFALTTPILGTPQSGNLGNCTAYTVANLADIAWTDISGSITFNGLTSATVNYAQTKKIGKTLFFNISVTGTSNSANFGIMRLPATSVNVASEGGLINAENNSASVFTANWVVKATSSAITVKLSNNEAGWTASGTKAAIIMGFYETT